MLNILKNSDRIIKNKYFNWYCNIIMNAWNRKNLEGYAEKHHIIPKSIYKNISSMIDDVNTQNNIVTLTAKEHFIVHLLLTKFTTKNDQRKMTHALYGLLTQSSKYQDRYKTLNSKTYEKIKTEFIKSVSGNNHWTKKASKEYLSSIAKKREATKTDKERKITNQKISDALKGKPKTQQWYDNAPKSMKGKKKTKTQQWVESRKRIQEEFDTGKRKGNTSGIVLPKFKCPHCGKEASKANLDRWHNDNCKFKKQD